jgi:tRNA-binding EMAP/Myf-like protein
VLAVVNFPPRQIGPFMSQVLTLGVPDEDGQVVLITPDNMSLSAGGCSDRTSPARYTLSAVSLKHQRGVGCGPGCAEG